MVTCSDKVRLIVFTVYMCWGIDTVKVENCGESVNLFFEKNDECRTPLTLNNKHSPLIFMIEIYFNYTKHVRSFSNMREISEYVVHKITKSIHNI